jgi:hypothetical protein
VAGAEAVVAGADRRALLIIDGRDLVHGREQGLVEAHGGEIPAGRLGRGGSRAAGRNQGRNDTGDECETYLQSSFLFRLPCLSWLLRCAPLLRPGGPARVWCTTDDRGCASRVVVCSSFASFDLRLCKHTTALVRDDNMLRHRQIENSRCWSSVSAAASAWGSRGI